MIKPVKPVSLVIVVHQEAESIESVVREFYKKVTSKIPGSEFIVCEDGSTDGTKEILRRIQAKYHLTLDLREGKRGYTRAMRDGLAAARNPLVFFSDSDGQHDPSDFWKLYEALAGCDLAVGWKEYRRDAPYRLALTRVFNWLLGQYFRVRVRDANCGFRLMRKEVVDFWLARDWRLNYCNNAELTVKALYGGFCMKEVPVSHFPRRFGVSRGLPIRKLPKIIGHILKSFPLIKREAMAGAGSPSAKEARER